MHRGGEEAGPPRPGALAATQMQPGLQRGGQPRVARHNQHQPPGPADGRDLAPQLVPVGGAIVAQHHAAQPHGQRADKR